VADGKPFSAGKRDARRPHSQDACVTFSAREIRHDIGRLFEKNGDG
jgi:hypothetical protein